MKKHSLIKKIFLAFVIYYLTGVLALIIFSVWRYSGNPNFNFSMAIAIAGGFIRSNILRPEFWGMVLVWPIILIDFFTKVWSGNLDY